MQLRKLTLVCGTAAAFSLTANLAIAQKAPAKAQSEGVITSSYKTPGYKVARAQDGHADLQGVWSNNTATPLQRPKQFAGKEFLTEQELTTLKREADKLFKDGNSDAAFGDSVFLAALANVQGREKGFKSTDGGTGDYSSVWTINRDWTNRTSLVIDPKDGRVPELTALGKELAAKPTYVEGGRNGQAGKRPDSYEDIGLTVRCITFGSPRIGAGYNSYMQIFQSPKAVVIEQENIHDARVIPVDGSQHPPANVKFINGDSRGHWEGDTLVVDTTNYLPNYMIVSGGAAGNTDKLHIVERYQRTAENYVTWTVTFDDPGIWTKPWTVEVPLRHSDDALFEYACHEGNYGLAGILAGARKADADDAKAGSR